MNNEKLDLTPEPLEELDNLFTSHEFSVLRQVSIWIEDKYIVEGETFGEAKAKMIQSIVLEDGEWGENFTESEVLFDTEDYLPPSHNFATKEIVDSAGNIIWDNKL